MQYLCFNVWENEWSGILFYRTEGKFSTPDFKIILEDILPMHVGDAVSTSYDYTGDVIRHMKEHPHLAHCKKGHIHSHHNMSVYFSNTDEKELQENSRCHDFYLSLIVNNRGDMAARIGFIVKRRDTVSSLLTFLDEEGNAIEIAPDAEVMEKELFFSYDCEIRKVASVMDPAFEQRCRDLLAARELEIKDEKKWPGEKTGRTSKAVGHQEFFFDDFDAPMSGTDYSERATTGHHPEKRVSVEHFLRKVFQDDHDVDDDLVGYLEILSRSRSKDVILRKLRERLAADARRYYMECYPDDRKLMAYDATLEECILTLGEFIEKYPVAAELCELLSEILEPIAYEHAI